MSEPRWTVRVRTASTGPATVTARKHRLDLGEPAGFGDADPYPSALEAALGALAAELANGLRAAARKRRVPFDEAEVSLAARLENPLVALGVIGEEGSPALACVEGTVYVSSPAPDEALAAVFEEALARAPLYNTLRKAARLSVRLQIVP